MWVADSREVVRRIGVTMASVGDVGSARPHADAPLPSPPSALEAVAASMAVGHKSLSRYELCAKLLLDERDAVLRQKPRDVEDAIARLQQGAYTATIGNGMTTTSSPPKCGSPLRFSFICQACFTSYLCSTPLSLCAGTHILKFGRSGKPHRRFLRVTEDLDAVYYMSRRKKLAESTIALTDVDRVQTGQHTSVFGRQGRTYAHLAPLSLSIVCTGGRTLDLVFDDQSQCDAWHLGLQALLIRAHAAAEDSDIRVLRRAFLAEAAADAAGASTPGGDGNDIRLGYNRVKAICNRLNIGVKPRSVLRGLYDAVAVLPLGTPRETMTQAAAGGTSSQPSTPAPEVAAPTIAAHPAGITFAQFVRLVDLVRDRPDIRAVYGQVMAAATAAAASAAASAATSGTNADASGVANGTTTVAAGGQQPTSSVSVLDAPMNAAGGADAPAAPSPMPANVFLDFLRFDQKESTATLADAMRIAAHFDPVHGGAAISLHGFTSYLSSPANTAFAPQLSCLGCGDDVSEYMSHPLSHYWICSSHNTYLEGDQLTSNSSVNAYLSAVHRGCRCVELDCWDGPAGEPIIYHGRTLTSKVPFNDVCAALAQYGFRSSPYPLILSLEVHCSPRQQDRMAAILQSCFGDLLLDLRPGGRDAGLAHDGDRLLPSPLQLMGRVVVKAKLKKDTGPHSTGVVTAASSVAVVGGGSPGTSQASGSTPLVSAAADNRLVNTPIPFSPLMGGGGVGFPVSTDGAGDGDGVTHGHGHAGILGIDVSGGAAGRLRAASVDLAATTPVPPPPPTASASASRASTPVRQRSSYRSLLGGSLGGSTPAAGGAGVREMRVLSSSMAELVHLQTVKWPITASAAPAAGAQSASAVSTPSLPASPSPPVPTAIAATAIGGGGSPGQALAVPLVQAGSGAGDGPVALSPWPSQQLSGGREHGGNGTAFSAVSSVTSTPVAADGLASPGNYIYTGIPGDADVRQPAAIGLPPSSAASSSSSLWAGASPWTMTSIKEPEAARALARGPAALQALICHTVKHMVRIYPGSWRVDSSNFNPIPYWACGAQMVALNYQTADTAMRINRSWFRVNGKCGYVLKPQYMRRGLIIHHQSNIASSLPASSTTTPVAVSYQAPPLPGPFAWPDLPPPSSASPQPPAMLQLSRPASPAATVAALTGMGATAFPAAALTGRFAGTAASGVGDADSASSSAAGHHLRVITPLPDTLSVVLGGDGADGTTAAAGAGAHPESSPLPHPTDPGRHMKLYKASPRPAAAAVVVTGADGDNGSGTLPATQHPLAAVGAVDGNTSVQPQASASTAAALGSVPPKYLAPSVVTAPNGVAPSPLRQRGDKARDWLWQVGSGAGSGGVMANGRQSRGGVPGSGVAVVSPSSSRGRRSASATLMQSSTPSPLVILPQYGVQAHQHQHGLHLPLPSRSVLAGSTLGRPPPFTLSVTIMGAQHLPKRGGSQAASGADATGAAMPGQAGSGSGPTSASAAAGRVPSPYCSVIIYGGDQRDSSKYKTRTVPDNGFNPVWSEQFRFTLHRPDVAVLYIAVHDASHGAVPEGLSQGISSAIGGGGTMQSGGRQSTLLAYFACPVSALRAGYRSCPLRSATGKKYPFCSLLCRFQRK